MWTMLCNGLIMKPSSDSCCSLPAKLSNPVMKKPTTPTSRYTTPKASATICGQGRAPVPCFRPKRPSCSPDSSVFRQVPAVRRCPSARGRARPTDDERADREQVDGGGAEALQRVARVVDHRAPGGVQAGVDDHRQAGTPLEALE